MVIEKYGPPIVRKTRQMATHKKDRKGKNSASSASNPNGQVGLLSQDSKHDRYRSSSSGRGPLSSPIDNLGLSLCKENVGVTNRPLLLMRSLQLIEIEEVNGSASKQKRHFKDNKASQQQKIDHLFRLEFDESSGIPPCWVDTKTLNFFNTLRDNIFSSSSQYDRFITPTNQSSTNHKKKKKIESPVIVVDKESVAYQRGKRSCTLQDIKSGSNQAS